MADGFTDVIEQVAPGPLLAALEQAADQLGTGVFAMRVDVAPARVVYVSAAMARMLGRSIAEVLATAPWDLMEALDRDRLRALITAREHDAPPLLVESAMTGPGGTRIPVEAGVVRTVAGGMVLAIGYVRDISRRIEAVAALKASERRFRTLIEGAPDGVVISRHGRVLFMNAEGARLLGLPSVEAGIGRNLLEMLPVEDSLRAAQRMAGMLKGAPPAPPSDYRVRIGDEERVVEIKSIVVEFEGQPAVLGFARDATERHRLGRDLERADRLAVIGTLAAAVAHEINNPLTYTHLSLEFLEHELAHGAGGPRQAELLEHVRHARHGADRVATIVRDLRVFTRVDDTPIGAVDVTEVVERALAMAEHDLRHRARLVRDYAEVPTVFGSASRLEQVFLNLLINAIQALPAGDPARDSITVQIRGGAPGEVVVAVTDTGAGVAAAVRDRIFEPFFTTKPAGEGTGLGLTVCRTILDSVGGRISLGPVDGAGTRIEVTLRAERRAERRAEPPATPPAPPAPLNPGQPRRLRALVIDDEAFVLQSLRLVLEPQHHTTCVAGGAAALALLDDPASAFDVILCDLMMPGLHGADVHAGIAARRPGLERRIVFMTGGAFLPPLAAFLDRTDNLKVLKPFNADQLLAALQAAAAR